MDTNTELQDFLAQPGAMEFLDLVRPYVQRGQSLAEACESVKRNWMTLLKRVGDGLFIDDSRFAPAAQALKHHLADQVWNTVNGVPA